MAGQAPKIQVHAAIALLVHIPARQVCLTLHDYRNITHLSYSEKDTACMFAVLTGSPSV